MNPSAPDVHRGERAGIPLLWSPAEGNPHVALVFRVGRVDETYVQGGISHLCEHLVLTELGLPPHEINGFAGPELTGFTAHGTMDEVTAFLAHVATSLADLPTDRLDHERGVLEIEAGDAAGDMVGTLNRARWGLTALGRIGTAELGVRNATAELARAWARERFTAESAVLCWVGPEPPELDWRLPTGARQPLPAAVEPMLPLPFAIPVEDAGTALAVTLPAGSSTAVFADLFERRVTQVLRHDRGLIYELESIYVDAGVDLVMFALLTDIDDARAAELTAAMLHELGRLADGDVDLEAIAASRRGVAEHARSEGWIRGHLLEMAARLLTDRPVVEPADDWAAVEAVDADAISRLARGAQASAILYAPPSAVPPTGWKTKTLPPPPITGRTFRSGGRLARRRDELVVGQEGFTIAIPGEDEPLSMAWRDLVAVTRERDGTFYLTARDASWCVVSPERFKGEVDAVVAAIEEHLDPATLVAPLGAEHEQAVAALVERDLKKPKQSEQELRRLLTLLDAGEEPLALTAMISGIKTGLIAVTDRRTIFLYVMGEDETVEEVRHTALGGVRVDEGWKGKTLVLETHPEPRSYWGSDPKDEPDRIRDLIRTLIDG